VIERLHVFDQKLFLYLNAWHAEWLNPYMVFLSGQIVWLPLLAFLLWTAFNRLDKKAFAVFSLFLLIGVIASDVTSSYLLKNIVQRLRPCRLAELKPLLNNFGQKCGGRFGFVSSHAANSFFLLMFSFIALKLSSWRFHVLWLVVALVGYSRVYLGVHYPGDIIGGIVVGGVWALVLGKLFSLRRQTI